MSHESPATALFPFQSYVFYTIDSSNAHRRNQGGDIQMYVYKEVWMDVLYMNVGGVAGN